MKDPRCQKAFDLLNLYVAGRDEIILTDFFDFITDNMPYVYDDIKNIEPRELSFEITNSEHYQKMVLQVEKGFDQSSWNSRSHENDEFDMEFITGIAIHTIRDICSGRDFCSVNPNKGYKRFVKKVTNIILCVSNKRAKESNDHERSFKRVREDGTLEY